MKLSLLQHQTSRRGVAGYRHQESGGGVAAPADGVLRSPSALFWVVLHGVCCVISLVLGFRFSRLVFFLIFSAPSSTTTTTIFTSAPILHTTTTMTTTTTTMTTTTTRTETLAVSLPASPPPPPPLSQVEASLDAQNKTRSRVVVGRHGIHIRPWAHPDPTEVTQAHWIIERVQREQRLQYGVRSPQPIIVVTPTYVRTFQTLHLTGLLHSLLLVPYPLTWLVVEAAPAGRPSNDTASFLARSGLNFLHIPFPEPMPEESRYRRHAEARMRLHALRVVRQRRMDGIVVFADDSNVHTVELFDEAQKVKWMGAISVGILTHTGRSDAMGDPEVGEEEKEEKSPMPIQGPACNSSGHLVGWHTYNPLPNTGAAFIGAGRTVLPMKMEWAGFVLNSRMLWREVEDKPDWVRDLDAVGKDDIDSPLALLEDASFIEPLGNCGKKVLLWWLRAEARYDSKFPSGWTIDPALDINVAAKHTQWIDSPPELPSWTRYISQEHDVKQDSSANTNRNK
ncbi:putative glucuronosyltransferase [Canna indica]|uniref:Glycosyltransferases n=1 Tax=Canna indica TaxID=4628 RepID=A0AAQ3KUW0_9LILI|nr:putative glucuronosyltransferase [Canna indica]